MIIDCEDCDVVEMLWGIPATPENLEKHKKCSSCNLRSKKIEKKRNFEDVLKVLSFHQEEFVCIEPTSDNKNKVSFVRIGESKGKSGTILIFFSNYNREKIEGLISELPSLY